VTNAILAVLIAAVGMAGDWVYDNMIAPQTNSTIDGFTRYFLADDDDYGSGGAMG
jgi:hypothetical protein